ncbi:MAG: RNA polymerase sigma factor RpoH [Gammaproteobacteria bacterium]|nr:MAG: RNA polymerase sigma factor RpoH [Gammaproteobacteria bacterium]
MSNSTATQAMTLPVIADDLNSYLARISNIELLSQEEEQRLARELRDNNDLDAARQLVMSQLRFVVHIAKTYKGYGLPMADLVQEGNIGLMKAVKRFDPDHGVRLISFAVHWIRAEIHEYVIRNWRIVKVATTKAQRKLFFKLRSASKQLNWFSADEVQAVADDLGVDPKVVVEMESRMHGRDNSFDGIPGDSDDRVGLSPAELLYHEHDDPSIVVEQSDKREVENEGLEKGLALLDDRSRTILERRWLQDEKSTLHELADEFGVSAERIRQIEKAAMKKIKTHLLEARVA